MSRWSRRLLVGVCLCAGVWLVAYLWLEGVLKIIAEVLGPVVGVLAPIAGEWWRTRQLATNRRSVGALGDLLAYAVRAQWRKAAAERVLLTPEPIPIGWSLSDLPVGSVDAAVGDPTVTPAFPPLPGQRRITQEDLRSGGGRKQLFALYAGLASGRIVVVGAPGAGKTGSAVLLVLDALDQRDHLKAKDRTRVPVPVLLTAQGWDLANCSVQDWLAARLAETYPLFQHRGGQDEAAELVASGNVALILDGLDEMDVVQRSAALHALSDVHFRVVVLTRTQELAQIADTAWLVGAVAIQLRDVTGSQAVDYLQRARTGPAPAGWTQLLTHLRDNPDSVVARGLSTPLALTLIRDTYRPGDDVSDLLDASSCSTADDIEKYLIARVLPDAYTPRPGRPKPPYTEAQARQTLTFFAQQMNQDHTRELGWWQIPRWTPTRPLILTSALASVVMGVIVCVLIVGLPFTLLGVLMNGGQAGIEQTYAAYGIKQDLWTTLGKGLLGWLMFGLGVSLPLGLSFGRGDREPNRIRTWRAISMRSILTSGLVYGLVFFLAVGFLADLLSTVVVMFGMWLAGAFTGPPEAASTALLSGPLSLLLVTLLLPEGLIVGVLLTRRRELLGGRSEVEENPQGLAKSRHKDRMIGFWSGVATWIIITGVACGLAPDTEGVGAGLIVGVVAGLLVGLVMWFLVWLVGLVPRLAGGFVARLTAESAENEGSPLGPLESWRNDRVFGFVTGLGLGLASGVTFGLALVVVSWISLRFGAEHLPEAAQSHLPGFGLMLASGLWTGLAYGAVVGVLYGITSSVTWPTTLAWRLQLQRSGRVPAVGLMPFFEDARNRGVLRTVGAVYQFRHAALQDHLAGTTPSP